MSERDRGDGHHAVTALFFALGACLLAALAWEMSASHTERNLRAEQNGARNAEQTQRAIDAACAEFSAPVNLCQSLREAVEAAEKERREEHDLNAQRDMADWAFLMVWVTAASVAVTGGGLLLIWRTLIHTRRAADYARLMVREAENATKAAQDGVAETRRIGEAQVRAYVSIAGVCAIDVKDGHPPKVEFRVINSGNSPAFRVSGFSRAVYTTKSPFKVKFKYDQLAPIGKGTIPAKDSSLRKVILRFDDRMDQSRALTQSDLVQLQASKAQIVYGAVLCYRDAFGRARRTVVRYLGSGRPDADGRLELVLMPVKAGRQS